ncbi:alpha/beta hydrolase fold domain-containing protein [Mycetocola sp. JXN-3]|uniref:alpha/beta hydrolase fold domain-containing protein n=1 Tax=Mycetocola sp. JXN-3 TaxID=2116510 RepID=UPI00165D01F8|nr:alpha/beta hydrolase fold domain-containing protein [Mycetocola sp. JXN-3]
MSFSIPPAPPIDAELKPVQDVLMESFSPALHAEDIPMLRAAKLAPDADELVAGRAITHTEHRIAGPAGELVLTSFRRTDHSIAGPAFYFTHVGGLIFGDAFNGIAPIVEYVDQFDAVVVTVEYRLAPENPAPAAFDDAYAGLLWTAEHAAELGFDPARLVVAGASAGGGLAAALALKVRDTRGPELAGQLLMYPVLDDRNNTVSARQIDGNALWDRTSNETSWTAILGERFGTDRVTAYEAPARAEDLSDLPPAFIEVGSAEVFRDEAVTYASRIWAVGGGADLHVWAGGFHLFDTFVPDTIISRAAVAARTSWVRRTLGL